MAVRDQRVRVKPVPSQPAGPFSYLSERRAGCRVCEIRTSSDLTEKDDIALSQFRHEAKADMPPIADAVSDHQLLAEPWRQFRSPAAHPAQCVVPAPTPIRCGADRRQVGFVPTKRARRQLCGGVLLGQAISVSGAAASPNMGYNIVAARGVPSHDVQRPSRVVVSESRKKALSNARVAA